MSWHHSVYCAVCSGIIDNDNPRFDYYLLINMNAVMFILEVLYVGTVVGTIIEVALLSQRAKKGKIFIGNWINAFLHLIMIVMLPAALEAIYCHWSTGEPKWTSPSIYIYMTDQLSIWIANNFQDYQAMILSLERKFSIVNWIIAEYE